MIDKRNTYTGLMEVGRGTPNWDAIALNFEPNQNRDYRVRYSPFCSA